MAQKPSPADAAGGARQSEFVMIAQFGAQPGGGIAEALTYVTPPGGSAAADVGRLELLLAPFGAPSEFARTGACQFGLQHAFPAPTGLVRKADPGEMEDLMDQDALELAALGEDLGIEQNAAARNIRCGQMRAEGAANFDADGTSGERRKHYCFAGAAVGPAAGPAGSASAPTAFKRSGSLMTA